jgi:hypothetical protein
MKPLWLFSRGIDLSVFLGSALLSMGLLVVGYFTGWLHDDTPPGLWLLCVVLVDVAHVWASAFVVYLDPKTLAARRALFLGVPIAGYVLGWALYSEGELVFWRALAYLAVFHFVRQQWGFVARYRRLRGETRGAFIDAFAIYTATLYPLLHWHLSSTKRFHWFMAGDFRLLPSDASSAIDNAGLVVFCTALTLYVARALKERVLNPGKDIVVATTALCWYTGIVAFDSDFAFTVTNVLIHGVPYFALVFHEAKKRRARAVSQGDTPNDITALATFLFVLWIAAFLEEAAWDKAIWQQPEHRAFFGAVWDVGGWKAALVPLLALPQVVHYVLDGFIWRRSRGPSHSS